MRSKRPHFFMSKNEGDPRSGEDILKVNPHKEK